MWTVLSGSGWQQWRDLPAATAWLDRAAAIAAQPMPPTYAEQVRQCRDLWTALAWYFRACNVPPLTDPTYRIVLLSAYGSMFQQDAADAENQRFRAARSAPNQQGSVQRTLVANLRRVGYPTLTNTGICNVLVRMALGSPEPNVIEQCASTDRNGEGPCYYLGPWSHCADLGASTQGCEPWSSNSFAWFDTPGSEYCPITSVLPPLRMSVDLAADLTARLRSQPIDDNIADARRFAILSNAETAYALGLLPDGLIDRYLAIRAANTERSTAVTRTAADALGLAAAALIAIPGTQIAGVVLGILSSASRLLPGATGSSTDAFGLLNPVYLRGSIATTIDGRPTIDVPMPPAQSQTMVNNRFAPSALRAGSFVRTPVLSQPVPVSDQHPPRTPQTTDELTDATGRIPAAFRTAETVGIVAIAVGALWYLSRR